jgi:hypothetical protein
MLNLILVLSAIGCPDNLDDIHTSELTKTVSWSVYSQQNWRTDERRKVESRKSKVEKASFFSLFPLINILF